jgi:hypothetical protein
MIFSADDADGVKYYRICIEVSPPGIKTTTQRAAIGPKRM